MAARHRRCPTPSKIKYASYYAATLALRRMPVNRVEARAYKCRTHWHLTSH